MRGKLICIIFKLRFKKLKCDCDLIIHARVGENEHYILVARGTAPHFYRVSEKSDCLRLYLLSQQDPAHLASTEAVNTNQPFLKLDQDQLAVCQNSLNQSYS